MTEVVIFLDDSCIQDRMRLEPLDSHGDLIKWGDSEWPVTFPEVPTVGDEIYVDLGKEFREEWHESTHFKVIRRVLFGAQRKSYDFVGVALYIIPIYPEEV